MINYITIIYKLCRLLSIISRLQLLQKLFCTNYRGKYLHTLFMQIIEQIVSTRYRTHYLQNYCTIVIQIIRYTNYNSILHWINSIRNSI